MVTKIRDYDTPPEGYRIERRGRIKAGDRVWEFCYDCWSRPITKRSPRVGTPISLHYPWTVARRKKARKK